MIAETVYNIMRELPQRELQRFYKMIDKDRMAVLTSKQKKVDPVWTLEEYVERVFKIMLDRRDKRVGKK